MRSLSINGNPPEVSSVGQHSVSAGCVDFDDYNKPCINHLCRNGKCVPNSDEQTYDCKCNKGWSGPFCDQGMHNITHLVIMILMILVKPQQPRPVRRRSNETSFTPTAVDQQRS